MACLFPYEALHQPTLFSLQWYFLHTFPIFSCLLFQSISHHPCLKENWGDITKQLQTGGFDISCDKRVVLKYLLCIIRHKLDLLQFAYQAKWSVDNAVSLGDDSWPLREKRSCGACYKALEQIDHFRFLGIYHHEWHYLGKQCGIDYEEGPKVSLLSLLAEKV